MDFDRYVAERQPRRNRLAVWRRSRTRLVDPRARGSTLSRAVVETSPWRLTVRLSLVPALVIAGIIEAFVTGSTLSTAMSVGLGASVQLGFLSYLYVCGRRGAGDGRDLPAFTWAGEP